MMAALQSKSHSLQHVLVWALVHFLWQGTVLAGVLSLCLRTMRGDSASRRSVCCYATLVMMLCCPILTFTYVETNSQVVVPQATTSAKTAVSLQNKLQVAGSTWPGSMIRMICGAVDQHSLALFLLWLVGSLLLLARICLGLLRVADLERRAKDGLPESLRETVMQMSGRLGASCPGCSDRRS